jgi:pimeloyl-ACP methyl ester carboxylesterase
MRSRPFKSAVTGLFLATALCGPVNAYTSPISLFREPEVDRVQINPSGTLIAAHVGRFGSHGVLVQDTKSGKITPVVEHDTPIRFWWIDDDTLYAETKKRRVFVHLAIVGSKVEYELKHAVKSGYLLRSLPQFEDAVLWSYYWAGRTRVYRMSVDKLIEKGPFQSENLVASLPGVVRKWVSDREGVPRAAFVVTGEDAVGFELLYREDAKSDWRSLGEWESDENYPRPLGIATNGRDLLVASDEEGREATTIREFLVDEKALGPVVFEGLDVEPLDVLYGYYGHEVVAVRYLQGGLIKYHYLRSADSSRRAWLESEFPNQSILLTSWTVDGSRSTALVVGPSQPGAYYYIDDETKTTRLVGRLMPWLDPSSLADVRRIEVKSKDGLSIEAFYAAPRRFDGDLPPLVVMPHGGPLGVSDDRHFNPVVQFIASAGFAVLQVNYRGSGGKGLSFLKAGLRAWGKGIEDDVEAAVDDVIARGWADPDRACIFGGSYGGYSALISITRRPQKYRCAIAIAPVTDLLLTFDEGERSKAFSTAAIGDPGAEREEIMHYSPIYRAQDMNVPIFLMHGETDVIVDIEHSHRMRAMLDLYGVPYEWLLIEDGGHSPTTKQWRTVLRRLHVFLDVHLVKAPAAGY